MGAARRPLLLVLAALLASAACRQKDDDLDRGAGGGAGVVDPRSPQGTSLNAVLGGEQQVPPIFTAASGTSNVFVPVERSRIDVTLSTAALFGARSAQIRAGEPGVDGPPLFDLATAPFDAPLRVRLGPEDLQAQPAAGILTFDQALDALLSGRTYIDVRTTLNPAGELRGQIGPATLRAELDGSGEVPPVATPGRGTATFTLNEAQTQISFSLDVEDLVGVPTGASLLAAPAGLDGPVVFDLSTTTFAGPIRGTLSASSLRPQPGLGITTFDDAVNALLSGGLSAEVRTTAFPGGEIRGLAGPLNLRASLDGVRQVPPVLTAGTGALLLTLNGARNEIGFTLDVQGLPTAASSAQIRLGAPGLNGPVLFELAAAPFASPLRGTLRPADFRAQPALGIATFDDAVVALLGGNAHVVVGTAAFPDGEIRGQIGP